MAGGRRPLEAAIAGGGRNPAGGTPGKPAGGGPSGPKGVMDGRYPGGIPRRGAPKAVWGRGGGGGGWGWGWAGPAVLLLRAGVTFPAD